MLLILERLCNNW